EKDLARDTSLVRLLKRKLEAEPVWAQGVQGRTVQNFLAKKAEAGDLQSGSIIYSEQDIATFKHIRTIMQPYISGSKAGFFRGKSNVRADTQVVVFRVGESKGKMLDIAMYIVFGEIYNRVLSGGNERNKIVLIDEAWKLLSHAAAGQSVQSFLREGRKVGTGTWILSQNISDFHKTEDGKAVLTQTSAQVFMQLTGEEVELAQDIFKDLPPDVAEGMPEFQSGQGLLRISKDGGGSRTVRFYLMATDLEATVASTSSKEIEDLSRA
ncbi:MAG: ATP-binding protein, partial [Desulfobacterales bacterium]|nr:ATP-binding protein [Desulfobacterales bacterium]